MVMLRTAGSTKSQHKDR